MAPPKKFASTSEVNKYYDDFIATIPEIMDPVTNATSIVFGIFTAGFPYKDGKGNEKISDENTSRTGDAQFMCKDLYGKGTEMLGEADLERSAPYFMMLYCRANGVSGDEILTLGKNPDSEEAKAIRLKIEGLKAGYNEMIQNNDVEKFSDMIMTVLGEYAQEKDRLKDCDTLEGLGKALPYLQQFVGATTLQQSLEDSNNENTPTQQKLKDSLTKKFKEKYGEKLILSDLIGTLQLQHNARTLFEKNNLQSKAALEIRNEEINEATQSELVSLRQKARGELTQIMRGFYQVSRELKKMELEGNQKFYTPRIAHFSSFNASFAPDLNIEGTIGNHNSSLHVNERKLYAGDSTGQALVDSENVANIVYNDRDGKTEVNTDFLDPEGVFNYTKFNRIYDSFQEPEDDFEDNPENEPEPKSYNGVEYESSFMAELAKKIDHLQTAEKEGRMDEIKPDNKIDHIDVFFYLSDLNKDYTQKQRSVTDKVFLHDPSFRPSSLDPIQEAVLKAKLDIQYLLPKNTTVAEFATGAKLIEQDVQLGYGKAPENADSSLVNTDIHNQFMKMIGDKLSGVDSTLFSSAEFKKMSNAFHALENPTLLQKGNEKDYRQKMQALENAANEYIYAKETDGKSERTTDRGQLRYNLAKQMRAFAKASKECVLERINQFENLSVEQQQESRNVQKNEEGPKNEKLIDNLIQPENNVISNEPEKQSGKYEEYAQHCGLNNIDPYAMLEELANDARNNLNAGIAAKNAKGMAASMKTLVVYELAKRDKATGYSNVPGYLGEEIMSKCSSKEDVKNFLGNSLNLGEEYDTFFNTLKSIGKNDKNAFFEKIGDFTNGDGAKDIANKIQTATIGTMYYLKTDTAPKGCMFGKDLNDINRNIENSKLEGKEVVQKRIERVKEAQKGPDLISTSHKENVKSDKKHTVKEQTVSLP